MGGKKDIKTVIIIGAVILLVLITPLIFMIIGPDRHGANGNASGSADLNAADEAGNEITEEPVEDGLVRIASDQELGDMDVAKNSDTYYLALNVFDRLVEIETGKDGTPEIVPSVAKEWTQSPEGMLYTFYLRDDVVFSNGKPLTAKDVKFSLTRLLTVPDSEQTAYADMIQGADDLMAGKTDELRGIQIVDDHQLRILLSEPFPSFISMLGSPACSILCEEAVEEAGDSYGTDIKYIIGSGPYVITQKSDEMCTLEANPKYWGEAPSVKKAELNVMVHAVINREFGLNHLDLLDLDYLSSESKKYYLESKEFKNQLISKDNVGIVALMLNTGMPPLDDVRVRKAVQCAIDRDRIIDEVWGGYATKVDGIYPKGLIGYTEDNQGWLKYDPEMAKKLLKAARVDSDYTIELVYGATADTSIQRLTEIVQENLSEVGLNAVIVIYDPDSRLYLRRNGEVMAYMFDWYADYDDPDNFIYSIFGSEETTKKFSSNYKDPLAFKRIGKARTMYNEEKRLKEYASLERKLVVDDAVWVPLYSSKHVVVKGNRIKDYTPYWAGWNDVILKNMELK